MLLLSIYITLAIGVSFLCSVLEATLLSVTPAYVAGLKKKRPRAAARLARLKDNIEAPLVAILTLNTIAHTAGAAGAGAQATLVFGSQVLGLFSALLTFAILLLSEIIPKTIGANYWRQLAPWFARPLQWLVWLCWPLIRLSALVTRVFSRDGEHQHIRSDMTAMADVGASTGELNRQESDILKQMLKAREVPVSAIMTPRTVIHSLDQAMTFSQFSRIAAHKCFSRIPLYDNDPDDIVGYIQRSDALLADKSQPDAPLASIKRPIIALPAQAKLMSVFELLLTKRAQIAVVVDEYGGVRGLVTMEDIVESLLGLEIIGRDDPADDMQQLARRLWKRRQKQRKFRLSDNDASEGEE